MGTLCSQCGNISFPGGNIKGVTHYCISISSMDTASFSVHSMIFPSGSRNTRVECKIFGFLSDRAGFCCLARHFIKFLKALRIGIIETLHQAVPYLLTHHFEAFLSVSHSNEFTHQYHAAIAIGMIGNISLDSAVFSYWICDALNGSLRLLNLEEGIRRLTDRNCIDSLIAIVKNYSGVGFLGRCCKRCLFFLFFFSLFSFFKNLLK